MFLKQSLRGLVGLFHDLVHAEKGGTPAEDLGAWPTPQPRVEDVQAQAGREHHRGLPGDDEDHDAVALRP